VEEVICGEMGEVVLVDVCTSPKLNKQYYGYKSFQAFLQKHTIKGAVLEPGFVSLQ
jgi:hypothetical protein